MSGTFNEIDVPPTLVSFAVDVAKIQDVITPELKKAGNKLVWLRAPRDQYDLPDYAGIMDQYEKLHNDIQAGKVVSAYALDRHGIAAAVSKMAFGNALGVKIEHNLDPRDFFAPGFGDIIMEVPTDKVGQLSITYTLIGEVTDDGKFSTEILLLLKKKLKKHGRELWKEYSRQLLVKTTKNRQKMTCIMQKTFMYANTKLQNRVYLSRYSLEQTANTTAHVLLNALVQWLTLKYSRT